MRRDYWALWALLAVAFAVFLCLSVCSPDSVSLGPLKFKTSALGSIFRADPDSVAADSVAAAPAAPEEPRQRVIDDPGKRVLLIGDSMIEGLAPRLAAYCNACGDSLYAVIWYSATSELYGKTHLISDYIRTLHPDYIVISLGGNELFVKDVAQKRQHYVRSILDEIGDIPYLWIGPPNWKPDTGINDLIADNTKPGCFFLSNGMTFDRKRDGAHPTSAASVVWMDSIMRWMPRHARYVLPYHDVPEKNSRPIRYYLHQPGELTDRPK